ncbi:MAG: right-handed parallel beta-helix repeat-containing protein [Anaerolineae bacterium]|jgi:hypothetical protein|nr:right-handed parallel beta-helix repeat-containing protein [Anaerolineae bacterium]
MIRKTHGWLGGVLAILMITALCAGSGTGRALANPHENIAFATIITVNSGTDPDDNIGKTCISDTPCTLRRAIVQARSASKPVFINFDIPADPAHGYDTTLQLWRIQVYNTTQTTIFRRLNGDITIDGSTQPGGRTTGPKIMIVGPGTGTKDGLIVGDVAGDNNIVIRGLGFQNLRTNIYVNTDNNIIEANWFGLNDAGTAPLLRGNNPQNGSGSDGVALTSGADGNQILNNYFLGLNGVAAAIRGTNNTFSGNFIGTRSNGRVIDKQTDPSLICTPVDWLGGSGISITDTDNTIENNVFAGIRIQVSQWSLQADSIRVSGQRHIIRNNRIGRDGNNTAIGVCGRGIYLSDGPKTLTVQGNQIIEPSLSAISLNGILYDANTLRGNVVIKSSTWPQLDGSSKPEDAIQVNPSLPDPFEAFKPAKVTQISGVTVQGTAGTNSPCPNCIIELFRDDTDNVIEALTSLAVVTANAQGNWTATLAAPLAAGQGIRTTSTTAQYNTIPYMNAGTTTGLSELFGASYKIYLPMTLKN